MLFKEVRRRHIKTLADYIQSQGWEPIAQEQLYGREYSCMTLRAKDGELLSYFIAWSHKKFGQSYKTVVKKDDKQIRDLIIALSEKLNSVGPLSFQLIRDAKSGELKIFESVRSLLVS